MWEKLVEKRGKICGILAKDYVPCVDHFFRTTGLKDVNVTLVNDHSGFTVRPVVRG